MEEVKGIEEDELGLIDLPEQENKVFTNLEEELKRLEA